MRWGRRLQCIAACSLVVAYAGVAHYCNSTGAHDLGAAVAVAPVSVTALIVSWRCTPLPVALLLTIALGLLVHGLWPLLRQNFALLYLVQESGLYGVLGATFSRSLRGGGAAVCTHLADLLHGPLSRREVRYTRRVTAAWAVFFFAIATLSVVLFAAAPLRTWSLYVNFCVLPLVGAMFVAEYLVRRRVLPEASSAGLLSAVRIYFANSP